MKKIRFIFLFFLGFPLFAQKHNIHLLIASDVKDVKFGVSSYSKIERLNQSFSLISKSLNYSLKQKYWYEQSYTAEAVMSYLKDSLNKISKNDIVIFYYLGRGQNEILRSEAELQFRNPQKKILLKEIENQLNNKGRLSIVIADCYEPYPKSRGLFVDEGNAPIKKPEMINEEFDTQDLFVINKNLSKINDSEWVSYSKTKDSLNALFSKASGQNFGSEFEKEKLLMILKRISQYPQVGFPEPKKSLKRKFDILPDLSVKYTSNRDFSCVIDSMFKKQTLLQFTDPLHTYLDTLIKIPSYDNDDRPAISAESFNEYIIRKVFFTNCGNFVVSNRLSTSAQNIDYTSSFYKNLSDLTTVKDTRSINNLELKDLLVPEKLLPQIKINAKNCPAAPSSEVFTLPKRFYSASEIEIRFKEFFATSDPLIKDKVVVQILGLFEKNAKIKVKSKDGGQKDMHLVEYLNSNKNITSKNISIPFQRLKRNSNYTLIETLLIVEL